MKKSATIILWVLCIAALGGIGFFISNIIKAKTTLVTIKEERLAAEKKEIEAIIARDTTASVKKLRDQLIEYVPVVEEQGTQHEDQGLENRYALIEEIETLALRYRLDPTISGVKFTVIPQTQVQVKVATGTVPIELREFSFQFAARGGWNDIVAYLGAMEQYPKALTISNVQLSSIDRGVATTSPSGTAWQVSFIASFIVRNTNYQ